MLCIFRLSEFWSPLDINILTEDMLTFIKYLQIKAEKKKRKKKNVLFNLLHGSNNASPGSTFFLRVWFPNYIQKTQSARKHSDSCIFLRFILWCSMSFSSDCIVNASVLAAYPKDGCFLHFDQLWLAAMVSSAKRKTFIFFKIFHFFQIHFVEKKGLYIDSLMSGESYSYFLI